MHKKQQIPDKPEKCKICGSPVEIFHGEILCTNTNRHIRFLERKLFGNSYNNVKGDIENIEAEISLNKANKKNNNDWNEEE